MRYRLLALTGVVVSGMVALTGALESQPSQRPATLPLPCPVADPAAEQILDRAVAAMAPERLGCVETTLWQKVTLPGLTFEADGRYLMGSQRRFRLEMHTRQGGIEATRLAVSDGLTLWEAHHVGRGDRAAGGNWAGVTKLDIEQVVEILDGEGTPAALRSEFLHGPRFGGVEPLLRDVRGRLIWVSVESVGREGGARLRLAGVWPQKFVNYVTAERPWPPGLPQLCRLELDSQTLWPDRIEWWGPATEGAACTLLAEVEFRDPMIYATLPPDRCATEFAFDPGKSSVEDQTNAVIAEYAGRLSPH
jgi:hypothetical protein